MNRNEIKERIQQNMANANLEIEELRVQPDPFIGWRMSIVSPGFEKIPHYQRKEIVLKGLENLIIEWLDLLTPKERERFPDLFIDSELEDIPLWPESVARQPSIETIKFPSHLDRKLQRPIVATFYSYRGGAGSSTALAYTAQILASRGRRVLCLDWDLEAPGLPALFGKESEIKPEHGLVDIFLTLEQEEEPDILEHILRVSDTDDLYCLPAGIFTANYARTLEIINLQSCYRKERNSLRELMVMLGDLPFKPDIILCDTHAGITSFNSPIIFDLADVAIASFYPNPQFQRGTANLVRALFAAKTKRRELSLTPEVRFVVSPIPNSSNGAGERIKQKAMEWIEEWLVVEGKKMFDAREVTHFVPYREAIATSDRILIDSQIWQDFEPVAKWLESFL